jgi:LysM repeat protein
MLKKLIIKYFNISILIILSFNLFVFYNLKAQTAKIEIQRSTEKVLIGGKVYFVHVVKKNETLYSIAKAYNVTVSDITSINQGAVVEIKPEQALRIPEPTIHSSELEIKKENNQVLHIVAPGQTLYSISRIYGVSVAEIETLNPEVKIDSLQINQVLKIPHISKSDDQIKDSSSNSGFILHKVEEKETLYSLSKKNNVSQDQILEANENLAKEGLKIGQEIKIPLIIPPSNIKADSLTNSEDKASRPKPSKINCDSVIADLKEKVLNIALLLPMFSSGTYTSDVESTDENQNDDKSQVKQTEEFNPISINFIEFYQGILAGLESIRRKGVQVNLHVYDTEKGISKLEVILKDPDFQKNDLIIGPVYADQLKVVSEFSIKNKIYLISPVTANDELLNTNPFIFQINPGLHREMEANIDLIHPDTSKNIIVVYSSSVLYADQQADFKALLKNKIKSPLCRVKEFTVFDNDFSSVKSEIDSLRENVIISPVTDEIFVTDLLGTLESKLVYCNESIIGMLEWNQYSGMDLNYLYDLKFAYNSPFYVDFEKNNVKEFLKNYRLLFGTEPVRNSKYGFNYGMLGHDVAFYFASAYSKFGKNFAQNLPCIKNDFLTTPFEFSKVSFEGGYANTYLLSVKYNKEYSIDNTIVISK